MTRCADMIKRSKLTVEKVKSCPPPKPEQKQESDNPKYEEMLQSKNPNVAMMDLTGAETINNTATRVARVLHKKISSPETRGIANRMDPASPFPNALGITDTTFQTICKPNATFQNSSTYFSGKHYDYGFKYQIVHSCDG